MPTRSFDVVIIGGGNAGLGVTVATREAGSRRQRKCSRFPMRHRWRHRAPWSSLDDIIPAVGRLSRDTTDLLVIARDMQRAGAGIRSLAEPFLDTTSGFAEIIFAILGVAAKLERRRVLERTARGRADAKEKGVKFGRKPTLTPHQQKEARKCLEAGETQRSVARAATTTIGGAYTGMRDNSCCYETSTGCRCRPSRGAAIRPSSIWC